MPDSISSAWLLREWGSRIGVVDDCDHGVGEMVYDRRGIGCEGDDLRDDEGKMVPAHSVLADGDSRLDRLRRRV